MLNIGAMSELMGASCAGAHISEARCTIFGGVHVFFVFFLAIYHYYI